MKQQTGFWPLLLLILTGILCAGGLSGQSYTYWANGDTSDFVSTSHQKGIVLAGGGTDNDSAMVWMLRRGGGGDVVVIRASGSNGYNSYLYSELGVAVHSVETIRFDNISASYDPAVLRKVRGAEVLFIAGGDQYDYYQYWRDTPMEDALNYLIQEKGITVGGTSAGMAILGDAYYTPPGGSLTSDQALANPFHANTNILGKGDFVHTPVLQNVITDTHYDQRSRAGRQMVFLARLTQQYQERIYGIACNEHTAVCIDEAGIARVFGDHPASNNIAYFLRTNCQATFTPEVMVSAMPLTWNRQQAAVQVYRMPGSMNPVHTFDLNDWQTASGGNWENWYVEQGVLYKNASSAGSCDPSSQWEAIPQALWVSPNPVKSFFQVNATEQVPVQLFLYDCTGQLVWTGHEIQTDTSIALPTALVTGMYILHVQRSHHTSIHKLIIE